MSRRTQLRRAASYRLGTRLADVVEQFDQLKSEQKVLLLTETPSLYYALARLVRMAEIAKEVDA